MMVLAAVAVISALVVEFAYNAHIFYEVAASQRDQLKAEYLARSAIGLVRLELQSEQQLRRQFAELLAALPVGEVSAAPFCKMIPLSSGLIVEMASGGLAEVGTPAEEKPKPEEGAEDPFHLGGDFEGSCGTEEGKINLNAFSQMSGVSDSPATAADAALAEGRKAFLIALMAGKPFEPIFEGRRDDIRKIANAIADWADPDDRINEAPGIQGGYEEALYSGLSYKPKNGKYTSTAELLLIPGVGDRLYRLMEPNVTVYGDARTNLCQASDDTIVAFVAQYVSEVIGRGGFNPGDEAQKETLLESVRQACAQPNPTPTQVAASITSVTGSAGGTGGAADTGSTGASGLASKITTTNRFYTLKGVGTAGDVRVRIIEVIDTQGRPNSWKTLYFRMESG